MIIYHKKYVTDLFKIGVLRRLELIEASKPGKWEMFAITTYGRELQVETSRGEPKTFASLEAARRFAQDIGFNEIEIHF